MVKMEHTPQLRGDADTLTLEQKEHQKFSKSIMIQTASDDDSHLICSSVL